jgi:hypothetical protein
MQRRCAGTHIVCVCRRGRSGLETFCERLARLVNGLTFAYDCIRRRHPGQSHHECRLRRRAITACADMNSRPFTPLVSLPLTLLPVEVIGSSVLAETPAEISVVETPDTRAIDGDPSLTIRRGHAWATGGSWEFIPGDQLPSDMVRQIAFTKSPECSDQPRMGGAA